MQGLIPFDPRQSAEMAPLMANAVGQALNFIEANPLTSAAMATSTTPVVGDVLGLAADAEMYATDPESRTPVNFALTAAGLIPFVPAASAVRNVARADTPMADETSIGKLKASLDQPETKTTPPTPRLSKTSYQVPVSQMSYETIPNSVGLLPRPVITPADLQGDRNFVIGLLGDRTMAGDTLVSVNNNPLLFPVAREGGATFMRSPAQTVDGAMYASDLNVMTKLKNKVDELYDAGAENVYTAFTSMSGMGGDFSTMMGDVMMAQINGQTISKKTAKEFDKIIRDRFPKIKWKGVLHPEAAEQLRTMKGGTRTAIVETMALDKFQKQGFPDIASARFAITDPRMVHTPSGDVGLEISRATPDAALIRQPQIPHLSYPVQIRGDYVGGFDVPLPYEVGLPTHYADSLAKNRDGSAVNRSIQMSLPVERLDQEYVDRSMGFLEQAMKND